LASNSPIIKKNPKGGNGNYVKPKPWRCYMLFLSKLELTIENGNKQTHRKKKTNPRKKKTSRGSTNPHAT
jgi:hypothetical protein